MIEGPLNTDSHYKEVLVTWTTVTDVPLRHMILWVGNPSPEIAPTVLELQCALPVFAISPPIEGDGQ